MKFNKKTATDEATSAVVITVGFIGEGVAAKQLQGMLPENISKYAGAITGVLGIGISAVAKDKNVKNVGRGMAVGGLKRQISTLVPESMKSTLALSGIDDEMLIEDYGGEFETYDPVEEAELLGLENYQVTEDLALL